MLTILADAMMTALRRAQRPDGPHPWADRFVPPHLREAEQDRGRRFNPYRDLRW